VRLRVLPMRGSRRVAARLAAAAEPQRCGALASLLLKKRAWGEIPSTTVQQIAAAAVADGAQCLRLQAIARIGSGGDHPANCERDLAASREKCVTLARR
jgi:hypothetical protein